MEPVAGAGSWVMTHRIAAGAASTHAAFGGRGRISRVHAALMRTERGAERGEERAMSEFRYRRRVGDGRLER